MKSMYSFDKVGLALGFAVIAFGSFVHYLIMVLGGMIVAASVMAHIVEAGNIKATREPKPERESFVQNATG